MNRAILVREKVTRLVKLMVEQQIKVTQRGSRAYVEYAPSGAPRLVNIPYIPDEASDEFLSATEGFLDHEVAHVLFTDYKAMARAKKAGVANMHNIIEDAFIEKKMASQFAGSGLNLKNVGEFFLKTYTDVQLKEHPENAVGLLMVPAIRALSGQAVFKDYMEGKWHHLSDVMSKIGEYAKKALPEITCSSEAVDVALKFKELMDAPKEKEEKPKMPSKPEDKPSSSGKSSEETEDEDEPEDEEDEPEGGGAGDSDPSDESEGSHDEDSDDGDESESDEPSDEDGDDEGESPEIDSDIDEEDHDASVTAEEEGEEGEGDKPGGADSDGSTVGDGEEGSDVKSTSFDDMEKSVEDYDKKLAEILSEAAKDESKSSDYLIYTKELDVIEPMKIGEGGRWDDSMLKSMQDKVDHMVGPLQKDLERAVAARSAATWSAGHRSGKLHSGALARLTSFNDDRAFRRKHINTTKDVAVSLLIDCSGSMNGRKIETAAYAAYGLSSVLDRMNIDHEVLGFTTQKAFSSTETRAEAARLGHSYARNETLYIPILKGFSERLGTENKKRFAALPEVRWLKENVDGESVQIAATRLLQRREKRKILIVLSDGQPACPGDFVALQRHLKKVVKEVEHQGVDVLGLGILSDAPKHFYSKYTLLNNIADLPTSVIGEIKRLLMKV